MKAHEYAPRIPDMDEIAFRPFRVQELDKTVRETPRLVCNYCGSLTVDDTIKAFQTPGVRWSGADWKYGWPHKLYIEIPCEPYNACVGSKTEGGKTEYTYGMRSMEHFKFYCDHLMDATPEQFKQWKEIVEPITRLHFELEGDRLKYGAPHHGYQGDGVLYLENGKIVSKSQITMRSGG